jgi:hypothetical protein
MLFLRILKQTFVLLVFLLVLTAPLNLPYFQNTAQAAQVSNIYQ